jgi:serine/threonine protein kinase/WD40 repeat protein
MGSVYLGQDNQLDRPVAIKIPSFKLDENPELLERFLREARAAATLTHPNICPVYDAGEVDGLYYLAMAYVEGQPLYQLIRDKPMPPRQAALLARQIALALQEAHDKGIVHRDLKPANIMINQRKQPVVMDFGLARRMVSQDETRLTQSGMVIGTPAYMPPEQVNADVKLMGPCCDIYSLGVVLYEMLASRVPFEGPMATLMANILLDEPAPPSQYRPDLDAALDDICLKALAKKPADRYPSMKEFAAVLAEYLRDPTKMVVKPAAPPALSLATTAKTAPAPARAPTKEKRTRRPNRSGTPAWLWIACAAGLTMLVVLLIVALLFRLDRDYGSSPAALGDSGPEGRPGVTKSPHGPSQPSPSMPRSQPSEPAREKPSASKSTELEKPKPASTALRILPVPEIHLKPGEKKTVPIRIERLKSGPMQIAITELPAELTASPVTIAGTEETAGLTLVASPEADPAQHQAKVRVGFGELEEQAPVRVIIDEFAGEVGWSKAHQGVAASVSFSRDGRLLASGGDDNTIRLWDVARGRESRERLVGHKKSVIHVQFSPDGRTLLSMSHDGTAILWDVATWSRRATLDHGGQGSGAAISSDGKSVATGNIPGTVKIWDMETATLQYSLPAVYPGEVAALAFSGDGRTLYCGGGSWATPATKGFLFALSGATNPPRLKFDHPGRTRQNVGGIWGLALSHDGKTLVSGHLDGHIGLWDAATGKLLKPAERSHTDRVVSVVFSPNGKVFATASHDKKIKLWNSSTFELVNSYEVRTAGVERPAFSPNGKLLAAPCLDGTVHLWRLPRE